MPTGRRGGGERQAPGATRTPPERAGGGLGGDQVEGRQAVRALLRAGRRRVRALHVAEGLEESPVLQEILDLAREQRIPLRMVGRNRLDGMARTESHQGVVASAEPLVDADLERLCRRGPGLWGRQGPPFLVVLDGLTDPHNVGAVLRTAEIAGATGAVLPRHRSAHVTPAVAKAAAGAIEHLPIALAPGIPSALQVLAANGVWTVGLDQDAERSVFEIDLAREPVALVLGAEGAGLGRLTRERCDVVVGIPQAGALESLNVSAAAAVALFEIVRRRSAAGD